jgi:hypothetical protein
MKPIKPTKEFGFKQPKIVIVRVEKPDTLTQDLIQVNQELN